MDSGAFTYFDFKTGSQSSTSPAGEVLLEEYPHRKRPRYEGFRYETTTLEKRVAELHLLETLTFYSHWEEDAEDPDLTFRVDTNSNVGGGIRRRHLTLKFSIASNNCELLLDEGTGTAGRTVTLDRVFVAAAAVEVPVQCWDLHVGAQIRVLGRRIALYSASLETRQWLEGKASALSRLKEELMVELAKYSTRPQPTAISFTRGERRMDRHGRSQLVKGGMSLRLLMERIHILTEELRKFRPSIATKMARQLDSITSLS